MNLNRANRLFANHRGAAVIELALVAPVLALTVIGIVDMSNAYSRKLALEQGAQRAVEKIMNTTESATVEATLANEVQCQVNGSTTSGGVTTCNTSCHAGHYGHVATGLHELGRNRHHADDHDLGDLRRIYLPGRHRAAGSICPGQCHR